MTLLLRFKQKLTTKEWNPKLDMQISFFWLKGVGVNNIPLFRVKIAQTNLYQNLIEKLSNLS